MSVYKIQMAFRRIWVKEPVSFRNMLAKLLTPSAVTRVGYNAVLMRALRCSTYTGGLPFVRGPWRATIPLLNWASNHFRMTLCAIEDEIVTSTFTAIECDLAPKIAALPRDVDSTNGLISGLRTTHHLRIGATIRGSRHFSICTRYSPLAKLPLFVRHAGIYLLLAK